MVLLKTYNDNSYLLLCSYLTKRLKEIQLFIESVRKSKDYPRIIELEDVFKETFSYANTRGHLCLKTERVLNPHYLNFSGELDQGNSSWFISLNIQKESLKNLNDLYGKQLSGLLRIFKKVFSVLNSPDNAIKEETLKKYEDLIETVNLKMEEFLSSSKNKDLIEKREKLKSSVIRNLPHSGLYHMTHVENLENILKSGLLSHKTVHRVKMIKRDISNIEIQNRRNRMEKVHGRNIQDYVPLYINPSNPMMGSVKVLEVLSHIVLLEIIPHVLVQKKETLFSDGNAAIEETNFYKDQDKLESIDWKLLQEGKWIDGTESQRIMCSEVLVPKNIEVFYIQKIIIKSEAVLKYILPLFPNHKGISIEINPDYFKTYHQN
jgi:ssDNA thymidine ADP-ribosyltransferase DarT-like protein